MKSKDSDRQRYHLALFFCFLAFAGVAVRMCYIQVYLPRVVFERSQRRPGQIHIKKTQLQPERGNIYSRNGTLLAGTLPRDILVMEKENFEKDRRESRKQYTIELLSEVLEKSEKEVQSKIERTNAVDFYWTRFLPEEGRKKVKKAITDKKVISLRLEPNYKRYYPLGEVGSTVLGFVNSNGKGQYGLEGKYDKYLKGEEVEYITAIDALSRPLLYDDEPPPQPKKGVDLELTIDEFIQAIAEEEISKTCELSDAEGGCVLVMDPNDGEMLAMAQWPRFDPNKFHQYPSNEYGRFKNKAVMDIFECGSLAKCFTIYAALAMKEATPEMVIDCKRPYYVGKKQISDLFWYKDLTVTEVLAKSVNVGTVKLAQKCGPEALYSAFDRFGLNGKTGIDLPSEASCYVPHYSKWSKTTIAVLPYGYEMTSTAISLCRAFAMIANGGHLVQPHVLRSITDHSRGVGRVMTRNPVKKGVLVSEPAKVLADMMTAVVDYGTARSVKIEGFDGRIAAKTGTAVQAEADEAGKVVYSNDRVISSMVGFFPIENPQVVISVHVWFPKGEETHGGDLCGPVFTKVGEFVADRMSIPRYIEKPEEFAANTKNEGEREIKKTIDEYLSEGLMPNLTGMTMGEVHRLLARLEIESRFSGSGFACRQAPEVGETLAGVRVCQVAFSDEEEGRQ